ncbi:MAG: hypothetical protein PH343_02905, partial [Nitrospira sp.]|nr:hypothetical protein [Nitrospira sp.]
DYQKPPDKIVSICSAKYFSEEFLLLQPAAIITLGGAAKNALLKIPALKSPPELNLKDLLKNIDMDRSYEVYYEENKTDLFITYFPRGGNKERAKQDIIKAARLAKIKDY